MRAQSVSATRTFDAVWCWLWAGDAEARLRDATWATGRAKITTSIADEVQIDVGSTIGVDDLPVCRLQRSSTATGPRIKSP